MNRRYRRYRELTENDYLWGTIVSGCFVLIGIFWGIGKYGFFGVLWTICALISTIVEGYNYYNKTEENKISTYTGMTTSDMLNKLTKDNESLNREKNDFDDKLRKLEKLKNDNLISEEEYSKKREEIINEKW